MMNSDFDFHNTLRCLSPTIYAETPNNSVEILRHLSKIADKIKYHRAKFERQHNPYMVFTQALKYYWCRVYAFKPHDYFLLGLSIVDSIQDIPFIASLLFHQDMLAQDYICFYSAPRPHHMNSPYTTNANYLPGKPFPQQI